MNIWKVIAISLVSSSLAACVSGPITRPVSVNPQLNALQASNLGQGRAVSVSVTDHSMNTSNNKGIDFVMTPVGAAKLQAAWEQGLTKLGFRPVSAAAQPARRIVADLRLLTYYVNTKNNTRNVVANFEITVYNHGKAIAHSYQSRVPAAILSAQPDQAQSYVNRALATVMIQVLQDQLMMQFLAQ